MNPLLSTKELPENYELAWSVDLLHNQKMLIAMNFAAIVLIFPLIGIFYVIVTVFHKTLTFFGGINPLEFLILIALMVGYIFIHELTHAFYYKKATTEKVKFAFHGFYASASVPGVYFYKKPYMKVGLAPAVIYSVLMIPFMFILDNHALFILFALFIVHFTGCVGDFYVCWKLSKYPEDTLIQDFGVGMNFYVNQKKEL